MKIFLALLASCLLAGCYTVPETSRLSLNLMPDKTLNALSASSFEELKKKTPISTDTEKTAMVQRVGLRIAEVASASADLPSPNTWEFVLFEDDQVNAFAMPGGRVAVYRGLFKAAKNEDQLAVVLGHEVAHVAAHHGNERVSRELIMMGVGAGLAVATVSQPNTTKLAVLGAYGAGSAVGLTLPFSRRDESEADHIGLIYTAKAGYDPREAIPLWQNMAALKETHTPEFLSTHPSHSTRIEKLKAQMPDVLPFYEEACKNDKK